MLNQALAVLKVSDEAAIRESFRDFEDRWSSLQSSISQSDSVSYSDDEDIGSSGIELLAEELQEIQNSINGMSVTVESEEDLYGYLEKLQILKAQVLNKKHQLNAILSKHHISPAEAEHVGGLYAVLQSLDLNLSDELDAVHTIREKFCTFNRMSTKVKWIV